MAGGKWAATAVSMGNPHCVVFATPDGQPLEVNSMDLAAIGPLFERHVTFPKKTNTEFVQARERSTTELTKHCSRVRKRPHRQMHPIIFYPVHCRPHPSSSHLQNHAICEYSVRFLFERKSRNC